MLNKGSDKAVLFMVFNRPNETRLVMEAIRQAKPAKLYVASDGARSDEEKAVVNEVREITAHVDWPCELRTLFRPTNLGCREAVSGAITWFFEHEPEGIILEDDCLPSDAFFAYCSAMLDTYRSNSTVMSISGSYFGQDGAALGHYFSSYALMWGWATWRDRWAKYEVAPKRYRLSLIKRWWRRPICCVYWTQILARTISGKVNTWDHQWILTVWRGGGIVCRPTRNLVSNLGFGPSATHTLNDQEPLAKLPLFSTSESFASHIEDRQFILSAEQFDEKVWAKVSWRSVLLIAFPAISAFKKKIENVLGFS